MEPNEVPDPLSKKLTGTPDQTLFVDGLTAPLGAVRLPLKNPVEVNTKIVMGYDPHTGVFALPTLYNPVSGRGETQRTMTTLIAGSASAVNATTIWTPAAGKRFRLMGFSVSLANTVTTVAGSFASLLDQAAAIFGLFEMAATTSGIGYSVTFPGNGYLSVAVNNVLRVNLSAALTAGTLRLTVWGTEE